MHQCSVVASLEKHHCHLGHGDDMDLVLGASWAGRGGWRRGWTSKTKHSNCIWCHGRSPLWHQGSYHSQWHLTMGCITSLTARTAWLGPSEHSHCTWCRGASSLASRQLSLAMALHDEMHHSTMRFITSLAAWSPWLRRQRALQPHLVPWGITSLVPASGLWHQGSYRSQWHTRWGAWPHWRQGHLDLGGTSTPRAFGDVAHHLLSIRITSGTYAGIAHNGTSRWDAPPHWQHGHLGFEDSEHSDYIWSRGASPLASASSLWHSRHVFGIKTAITGNGTWRWGTSCHWRQGHLDLGDGGTDLGEGGMDILTWEWRHGHLDLGDGCTDTLSWGTASTPNMFGAVTHHLLGIKAGITRNGTWRWVVSCHWRKGHLDWGTAARIPWLGQRALQQHLVT